MKYLVGLLLVLSIGSAYYIGSSTMGKKPTLSYKEKIDLNNKNHTSQLAKLNLEKYPELNKRYLKVVNLKVKNNDLVNLKNDLRDSYQNERKAGSSARELAFFYLDLLLKINKLDPKDSDTILELADLSFERRVFTKASEYYEEFLKLKNDSAVKARYASSLTFMGKYKEAINELNSVLEKEPKNFQALAFKTIALAQDNQKETALKTGDLALSNAPSDEAYTRFGSYLEKLKNTDNSLEAYLTNNKITKSKFKKIIKIDEKTLDIYFSDFPMDKMPSFAKEKFINNIKASLADKKEIETVRFIDEKTKKSMDEINLK